MNYENLRKIIWIPPLILGFALVLGLWIHGVHMASRGSDLITVTGSAKKSVQADLAKWTANFSRRADEGNLQSVLARVNADTAAIKKFILSQGFDEASIRFIPVQTDPIYDYNNNFGKGSGYVSGYNVRQEVRVENKDISKVENLGRVASKLIDQDIVPEASRTEFFYTKIADLRPELFAEATKDAKTRAAAIARGTGAKVGALRSAKTGVIQVLSPNTLDVSDYGAYDLSTKEKEVTATVSVSFELN